MAQSPQGHLTSQETHSLNISTHEPRLDFPGGWGRDQTKTTLWEGYGHFLEQAILKMCTPKGVQEFNL